MAPKRWSRLQIAIVSCSLVYAMVFVFMVIFHPGGQKLCKTFSNICQILPPLFAGICGILHACRGQHSTASRRIGWFLIGCGCFSWGFGQIAWTYYETILCIEVPFPSWADAGYLGLYPCLISGVLLLLGSMNAVGRTRLLLDSAITTSSVGVISWYFVVQGLWQQSDMLLLGKALSVAYPLSDVMALFDAIVLLNGATSNKNLHRSLAHLAIGIVLIAFADSLFTYHTLNKTYETGSWFDTGWLFGFLLIGYASLLLMWFPAEETQSNEELIPSEMVVSVGTLLQGLTLPSLVRVTVPYITVASALLTVAIHDYHSDGIISLSVCIAGCALIFLVVLRQVFTLLENQHLTSQLRTFNANLEQTIVRRTEQLTALHQLTKAVNNTLQVDQVLSAAAEHTQKALQSDAIIIWLWEPDVASDGQVPQVYLHKGLEAHSATLHLLTQQPLRDQVEIIILPKEPYTERKFDSACLRAPLLWQQLTVGAIGVMRWNASFGRTESELLESIGFEVGAALENARLYGEAVEAADRDSVTGLYNHRAIHQRLDLEFRRASVQNYPLAVMMMDMNNFKLFNDTYGHPVGDQVLKRVAQALRDEFRSGDILGRYGGDEFIAILPQTSAVGAVEVAERLRHRMMREGYLRPGDERAVPITLSFGIAAFPHDSTNRHELLTIADANLYAAKLSEGGIRDTSDLQRTHNELRADSSFEVLDAMVTAVDNKDRYTRRHSEDVTEYALWIAEELGLSEETMRIIRMGGLLHDVGKIGVPDEILRKPGRLTPEEYEVIKRHPHLGSLIVTGVPGMEAIVDIVRSHHERWDGQGYPDGLIGEDIPLLGRITAVADAFSAMTTDRPYRRGLDWDTALEQIRVNVGTQFDPAMARAFLSAAEKRRPDVALSDNLSLRREAVAA
jgi:diguanylate cyclase (GGDEF)-like protein/putative nucleotidyltransferase with HDIG domain